MELIVVITILVIIGTIAFINLGGFAASARDSVRISNLMNLKQGLDLFQIKSGTYPMPEGAVSIMASGTTIGYQGFAKDQIASNAKISAGGTVDPSDATMYTTYSVNLAQNKMQAMAFLEDGNSVTALVPSLVPSAFASSSSDYSLRFPSTLGDTLGILLDNGTGSTKNRPVQEFYDMNSFTGVDLTQTTTFSGYTIVFSKNDTTASVITSGTGAYTGALFTFVYNKRDDLLKNKNLASNDSSLLGYWDMSTTYNSGGALYVADLSGHGNSGTGVGLLTIGGEQGMHSLATRTNYGPLAMKTLILMQTGSSFTANLVYKTDISSGSIMSVGYFSPSIANRVSSQIGLHTDGQNILFDRKTSTGVFVGPTISIGEWHTSSIVYDGSSIKVYDNGAFLGTLDVTGFITPSNFYFMPNFWLMNGWTSATAVKGDNTLDEARVYNRVLSDSEIQTLYNATR